MWKGIQTNHALFQGEVIGNPVIQDGYAFLTLRTVVVQRDANGQYSDLDQDIPLMAEPGSPNVAVVEGYVQDGRKLQVWCQYKSWVLNETQHHAFVFKG